MISLFGLLLLEFLLYVALRNPYIQTETAPCLPALITFVMSYIGLFALGLLASGWWMVPFRRSWDKQEEERLTKEYYELTGDGE